MRSLNWNHVEPLWLVEAYAADYGGIDSEEALSERFDAEVLPDVIEQYGESDSVAINEAFNNWSDGLCKDGDLHSEQYNNYCYVGRLSDD